MTASTTAITPVSFNKAFPLEAQVQNHFGGSMRPVLYIVDHINVEATEQTLTINIIGNGSEALSFKGCGSTHSEVPKPPVAASGTIKAPAHASFSSGPTSYNLAIALRPGTLRKEVEQDFTTSLYQAITATLKPTHNYCVVNGPMPRSSDGALIWYVAFAKDIETSESDQYLSFTLNGVSAELGTGSRSTQVEFQFGNVLPTGTTTPAEYRYAQSLDVINHEGAGYAPLNAGILGHGTLLNQQGVSQNLSFFLQSKNGLPLALSKDPVAPTEIHFSFPYQNADSAVMYLGTASEVKAISMENGTYQYPINTTNVGIDNSDGFIEFKGTFTELEETSQSLIPVPQEQKQLAEQLFLTGLSEYKANIDSKTTIAHHKSQSLASWLSTKQDGGATIAVNLNPTANNPACGFDYYHWDVQYDSHNESEQSVPPGFKFDYNLSFSSNSELRDPGFVQYISKNYTALAQKILNLEPGLAVTKSLTTGSGATKIELNTLPVSTCLYYFYKTEYELEQSLNALNVQGPSASGAQLAAIKCAKNEIAALVEEAHVKSKLLTEFISATSGPLLAFSKAQGLSGDSMQEYWEFLHSRSNVALIRLSFSQYLYTDEDPNDITDSFSIDNWKAFGAKYGDAWDTLPAGISSSYNADTSWNDPDFLSYLKGNINTLCAQLVALNRDALGNKARFYGRPNFYNGEYTMLPCRAVYEFFRIQYELEQSLASYLPDFMLDCSEPFHADNWYTALQQALLKVPDAKNILYEGTNEVVQSWSDPKFHAFVKNNFTFICKQLSPYVFNGKSYIVPSQSLFEVLWFSYQETLPRAKAPALESLMNPSDYIFRFTNVLPSGDDGLVPIGITLRNLPGYWDTHFQVPVRKAQTLTNSNLTIGHSKGRGRINVPSDDPSYSHGNIATPGSQIDFQTGGSQDGLPNVSIEEHYGLNFYGTLPKQVTDSAAKSVRVNGQPIAVKQADLLLVNGRLGIGNVPPNDLSGDFTTGAQTSDLSTLKLKVVGDSLLNGTTEITQDLAVQQNTDLPDVNLENSLSSQQDFIARNDLTANTVANAEGEEVFPTGTVMTRVYYFTKEPVAPEGWLICDGTTNLIDLLLGVGGNNTLNMKYWPLILQLVNGWPILSSKQRNVTFGSFDNENANIPEIGKLSEKTTIVPDTKNKGKYYFYDPVLKANSQSHVDELKVLLPSYTSIKLNPPTATGLHFAQGITATDCHLVYLIKL